ncbi:hypothetical protein F2P81_005958 [Scophthalmus maximus]|uniref:Uncharacterized protein n=1 Tax=Scophthalmus maximus TaxID=52904 RepID=A0A6A4T4H2_SCOMX|nr:hypothetical protein F2P81_005958 [Scophthalmus maximus]
MSAADGPFSQVYVNAERQVCDRVVSQPYIPEVPMWPGECNRTKEIVRQVQLGDGVVDVLRHEGEARGRTVQQGSSLTGARLRTGRWGRGAVDPRGDQEQHGNQERPLCPCHCYLSCKYTKIMNDS